MLLSQKDNPLKSLLNSEHNNNHYEKLIENLFIEIKQNYFKSTEWCKNILEKDNKTYNNLSPLQHELSSNQDVNNTSEVCDNKTIVGYTLIYTIFKTIYNKFNNKTSDYGNLKFQNIGDEFGTQKPSLFYNLLIIIKHIELKFIPVYSFTY